MTRQSVMPHSLRRTGQLVLMQPVGWAFEPASRQSCRLLLRFDGISRLKVGSQARLLAPRPTPQLEKLSGLTLKLAQCHAIRAMRWIALLFAVLPLAAETVTFNRDIAPLIFQNCSPCHRPGEAAPFPLLAYEDVRKRASQIVAVTARRYMPPWPPEPGYGDFVGERRLTGSQLRLIAEWVTQGCPEGRPADLPPQPRFTPGWQTGPPDLIVEIPQPYHLPSSGGNIFRNFALPVDLKQTRYIRAIELRYGDKRVVHHANIWIDRRQSFRRRDGEDGQPGFPGMEAVSEAR